MNPLISLAGFFAFVAFAWLLSSNRSRVNWRAVFWGLGLQLLIGLLVFRMPPSRAIFVWLNDIVFALLDASRAGTNFLLGPLVLSPGQDGSVGFVLAFQVLPIAIFVAAVTAGLYHLRLLQPVVRLFARMFHRTLGLSGAESLCASANIFVGVESALAIRPYLARMTKSELLMLLSAGMATVASTTLGIYALFLSPSFPQIAGHLISASVISIPAAAVIAKILLPETESPETVGEVPPQDESGRAGNLMGALITGAMDGLKLAAGIAALLIAVLGIVALIDRALLVPSGWFGMAEPLSLVRILGLVFYPFAAALGIVPADLPEASRLLAERVMLTEVVSYNNLASMITEGQLTDPRTAVIMSYALCGFAHVASVAIFVGGAAALAPGRRDDLAALGWRALVAATLATLMTGAVAGVFSGGQEVVLGLVR
jgi:CNT family concentrative nucleoside transporter